MRVGVVLLAALLLASGCGSQEQSSTRSLVPGTLDALLGRPGPNVALVPGTSDFAPGPVRYSFLIVGSDGRPVVRPRARIWLATGLRAKPFARATASLESVGVPGGYENDLGVTKLYVATFSVSRSGTLWALAEPIGGNPIQGVGNLVVRQRTQAPSVGSKAFPSRTPTLVSERGNLAKLTTREPPDTELLRYSIADSLAAHKPFVVVFATPKFCTSRTCGPVVDVVDTVRRKFGRSDVRFIHVEVYRDNKPSRGYNRWFREWKLPNEPWIFLVGSDRRIKARFEGSVSVRELTAAVRRTLARGA